MPADNRNHGAISAPLRLLNAWRQRRRARMHSFMGMSDRVLADIGVRRADVYGALVGAMPLAQAAALPSWPKASRPRIRAARIMAKMKAARQHGGDTVPEHGQQEVALQPPERR